MEQSLRDEIHKGLKEFYNSFKELQERTKILKPGGYEYSHIMNVLKGRRNNDDILDLASQLLHEKRVEKEQRRILITARVRSRALQPV